MTSRGLIRNRERVLITGASGFVGGHLTRFLHEKGFEVWGVFHRHPRKYGFPIHWCRADLTHFKDVMALLRESRPDCVFHLAGQAVPGKAWSEPIPTLRVNVVSALYLFEGIARYVPAARVVVASSSHVYGAAFNLQRRISERVRPRPATPYGCGKLLMELAALNFVERHGLDIRIIRAFNQVGEGLNPQFAFAEFCRQVARMEKGKQPPVLKVGDIDVVRDFIPIRDAVQAYELILKKGKRGEIYNVGSGRGIRLREAVDFLRKKSGVPFRVRQDPSRCRRGDFRRIVSNPSKLRRLGWRPRESVWRGLQEILEESRRKVRG